MKKAKYFIEYFRRKIFFPKSILDIKNKLVSVLKLEKSKDQKKKPENVKEKIESESFYDEFELEDGNSLTIRVSGHPTDEAHFVEHNNSEYNVSILIGDDKTIVIDNNNKSNVYSEIIYNSDCFSDENREQTLSEIQNGILHALMTGEYIKGEKGVWNVRQEILNGLAGVVKYLNIGDWTWVKPDSSALQVIVVDLEKKQYQLSDGSFVSAVGFAKNKIATKEMYETLPIYSVGDNLVCKTNDKSFKVVGYAYSLRYKEILYKSDILMDGSTMWFRESSVKESDGYKYGYGQLLFIKGKSKKSIDYFYLDDRKKENGKELYNFGGDVWYTSDQIMDNDEFIEYLKNSKNSDSSDFQLGDVVSLNHIYYTESAIWQIQQTKDGDIVYYIEHDNQPHTKKELSLVEKYDGKMNKFDLNEIVTDGEFIGPICSVLWQGGNINYEIKGNHRHFNEKKLAKVYEETKGDSVLLRTEMNLLTSIRKNGEGQYELLKNYKDQYIGIQREDDVLIFELYDNYKYDKAIVDFIKGQSYKTNKLAGEFVCYCKNSLDVTYNYVIKYLFENGFFYHNLDGLAGTPYPVEWGSGFGSTDYPVESGYGLGDIGDNLLSTEMQLLKIKKMGDFGEKIGGSAKDRFIKGTKTPAAKKEKKTMEYLPLDDDTTSYDYMSFKNLRSLNYKPSVSYFQKVLKLNKIVSRVLYLYYYLEDIDNLRDIKTIIANSEIQSDIIEAVIDNDRLVKSYEASDSIKLPSGYDSMYISIYRNICSLAHYGLALEKTLGEDNFDWNIVRKIKISGTIIDRPTWSDEARQFYFNYSYGVVENNDTLLCLLLAGTGRPLISSTFKNMFGGWSLKSSDKYVRLDYAGSIKYDDFKERYVELFKEGIKLYEAKYGPVHKEDDKWHYEDKAGLFAKLREGDDYRMGRNAEPKDFIDTFGFRAVEFGETMPQKERWEHMNRTYDAFMDLAKILGVEPRFISLNKLGLCFGSRGRGGKNAASAHFEPVKFVINLTRKNGAGCLAHEWMHALDTALITEFKDLMYHLSDVVYQRVSRNIDYETAIQLTTANNNIILNNFYNFVKNVYLSKKYNFYGDAKNLDAKKKDKYWSKPTEMMARSFEFYIIERLKRNNQVNEYLAQIPERKSTDRAYPYPYNEDKDLLMEDYNDIFTAISNCQYELMESWSN